MNELWKPDVFVLGPGGAKGYLELGLLLKFEEENYLSEASEWTGCSIGSAVALMCIAGYTAMEMIDQSFSLNIVNNIKDINSLDKLSESPGLLTINSTEKFLKEKMVDKFGYVPTLKQLYLATGILFNVVVYNLDKERPEYMNKDTEPDLCCVKAVLMSMSIPGIVIPRVHRGSIYVDGAIGDPYPILYHDDGNKKILGVYIENSPSNKTIESNPILYLYRCAQASMKVIRQKSVEYSSENCKHISLRSPFLDATGLSLNFTDKRIMINEGYKSATIYLIKLTNPEITENEDELPMMDELNIINTPINLDMMEEDDIFMDDIVDDDNSLIIYVTPDLKKNIETFQKDEQILFQP